MPKHRHMIEELHETMQSLHAGGLIDEPCMHEFESLYRANPVPEYTGKKIKELRDRLQVSQAALAIIINTSVPIVRAWEAGTRKPGGPSCLLLDILDRKGIEAIL